MKAKFWEGYLSSHSMNRGEWFDVWEQAAKKAEAEDHGLIVFKVPRDLFGLVGNHRDIREIENLLQKKYPDK